MEESRVRGNIRRKMRFLDGFQQRGRKSVRTGTAHVCSSEGRGMKEKREKGVIIKPEPVRAKWKLKRKLLSQQGKKPGTKKSVYRESLISRDNLRRVIGSWEKFFHIIGGKLKNSAEKYIARRGQGGKQAGFGRLRVNIRRKTTWK